MRFIQFPGRPNTHFISIDDVVMICKYLMHNYLTTPYNSAGIHPRVQKFIFEDISIIGVKISSFYRVDDLNSGPFLEFCLENKIRLKWDEKAPKDLEPIWLGCMEVTQNNLNLKSAETLLEELENLMSGKNLSAIKAPQLTVKEIYEANKNRATCISCGKSTHKRALFTGTIKYCSCVEGK